MLCAVQGMKPRCKCGAILSQYNSEKVCGPCARRMTDEFITRASRLPRPNQCREPGCEERICEKAERVTAPRWRGLCQEHYDEQRARQSRSAMDYRSRVAAGP